MGPPTRPSPRSTALTGDLVTVRPATPSDARTAARVWRSAWLDGHRGRVPGTLLAARGPDYFDAQAAAWTSLTVLAVDTADRILGLVVVADDELVQLAVDQAARRVGVGTLLLEEAERRIGASYRQAWLGVVAGNVRARRFYERQDWRDTGDMVYPAPAIATAVPVSVRRYVTTMRFTSPTPGVPSTRRRSPFQSRRRCPAFRARPNSPQMALGPIMNEGEWNERSCS